MPKKINVDKMAEEYAAYGKKKRKPLSYAAKLITVLAVTAALVSASVICLSLYLTGVFDEIGELPPDNNTDNGEQLYEGFIDYTFNANKMPSGSYAEFTFLADGSTYKVQAYLFDSYAPNTVSNFISYVNKKFYNGKAFGEVTLGYDENGVPDSGKSFRNQVLSVNAKILSYQSLTDKLITIGSTLPRLLSTLVSNPIWVDRHTGTFPRC